MSALIRTLIDLISISVVVGVIRLITDASHISLGMNYIEQVALCMGINGTLEAYRARERR